MNITRIIVNNKRDLRNLEVSVIEANITPGIINKETIKPQRKVLSESGDFQYNKTITNMFLTQGLGQDRGELLANIGVWVGPESRYIELEENGELQLNVLYFIVEDYFGGLE